MIGILQHVAFEPPGLIEEWLKQKEMAYRVIRLFEDDPLPAWQAMDGLVVMGGPMNVYEDNLHPFLPAEKELIQSMIRNGKKVLGVCLGAQLVAQALGARVRRNSAMEIGWYPVTIRDILPEPYQSVLPADFIPLHWHGDMFEIPDGTETFAFSEACPSQAFFYQGHVLALQFHLEVTEAIVESLIEHCSADLLSESVFVQHARELKEGCVNIHENRHVLFSLLNGFFSDRI